MVARTKSPSVQILRTQALHVQQNWHWFTVGRQILPAVHDLSFHGQDPVVVQVRFFQLPSFERDRIASRIFQMPIPTRITPAAT